VNILGLTGSRPANYDSRVAFEPDGTSIRVQPIIYVIQIDANARAASFLTFIFLLVLGLVLGLLIPADGPADIVNEYLVEVGL